jgi:uncharacterized protein YjbJ (UPF0337 family)
MFYRKKYGRVWARRLPAEGDGVTMKLMRRAKNVFQMTKGKTKEVTGKVVGNQDLESDGANDQHKEHLKQLGDKVKDAIEEL